MNREKFQFQIQEDLPKAGIAETYDYKRKLIIKHHLSKDLFHLIQFTSLVLPWIKVYVKLSWEERIEIQGYRLISLR